MSEFTIKQIEEKLGVDSNSAYGLVRYLKTRNLLTELPGVSVPGVRGKPAARYAIKADAVTVLTDDIRKLLP